MTEGYGEGGTMKGLAIQSIVALLTKGEDMPDGTPNGFGGPRTVISITGEDLLRQGMAWRYRAAGANVANIVDLSKDEDGRPFKLNDAGLARIRETICRVNDHQGKYRNVPDYGGLYLDPMMSIAPRNVSQNTTFRSVILEPLDALCADEDLGDGGTFCWLMNHTTKDGKTVAGSAAAVQGPRMVIGFRQCKKDPTKRELYRMKTNITKKDPMPVPYCDEGADASLCVRWCTDAWQARNGYPPPSFEPGPIPDSASIFANLNRFTFSP
jgi:hypothetical protein